jgi:ComF family protein
MFSLDGVLGLIAPHQCLVCGDEGDLLCEWCKQESVIPLPSRCYRCQAQTEESAVCGSCRRHTKLKNVWVRASYEELPRQLVHRLKFERAQAAAYTIAEIMHETLPYLPESVIICHVPTATGRRRQRGYDQAELIAHSLARLTGHPHVGVLARTGQSRQVGAKRQKRQLQLQNVFRPLKETQIERASILLVDDIVTTGATLEAAAETLYKAGAKKLYAAAFAQKQ